MRSNGIQLSIFRQDPDVLGALVPYGSLPKDQGADSTVQECGVKTAGTWTDRELSAWAPPEDLLVSEWAVRDRMLPHRQSAAPGQWTNVSYYSVEVMDAFVDPFVETITVMASVQSSKTESARNMLGYAICHDPAPAIVAMPSGKALKKVFKHIETMIRESPAMAKHLTGNKDDVTQDEIRLDHMSIYFLTAGSSIDMRNIEARYLFCDEEDEYVPIPGQGDPLKQLEARATTFWNRKIVHTCTPTSPDGNINKNYQKSDKSKYWVPCPHCFQYQKLTFGRIKHTDEKLGAWPKDKRDADYIKVNRVARYECEHCHAEIDDRDKRWMLRYGTWVPEGHPIGKDGTVAIPRPRSIHRGFHWSALYSPWLSFSDVMAQFFTTKDKPEEFITFVNLWLGEAWTEPGSSLEWKDLKGRAEPYPILEVPRQGLFLAMGVDVHPNRLELETWAFGREEEAWLIHWGQIYGNIELDDPWTALDGLRLRPYRHASGVSLYISSVAVDAGDGNTTHAVRNYCRTRNPQVIAVKGSSKSAQPIIGRPTMQDVDWKGEKIEKGVQMWPVGTDTAKAQIFQRLQLKYNPDLRVNPRYIHFPLGLDDEFYQQLTAEKQVTVYEKGYPKKVWRIVQGRRNEALDTGVYAFAAAIRAGLNTVNWDDLERTIIGATVKKETEPPRQRPAQPKVVRSKWMGGS